MALRGVLLGASPMLLAVGGCEINKQPSSAVSKVSTAPLIIDRATEIRDAEPKTAWYSNGSAVAGGTAFVFKPSEKVPPAVRRFTDAPVAALNDVSLPVGLFLNPPWRKTIYSGEVVPPSCNAMPPLPQGEQRW
jgi:hypothetical protein